MAEVREIATHWSEPPQETNPSLKECVNILVLALPLVLCSLAASFMPHPLLCFPYFFLLGKGRRDGNVEDSLGRCLASFLSPIDLKWSITWITSIQTPVFLLTILMELLTFYCTASKVRITSLCNLWCEHWQHYTCWFKNAEVIKIQVEYLQHLMDYVYLFYGIVFSWRGWKKKEKKGKE